MVIDLVSGSKLQSLSMTKYGHRPSEEGMSTAVATRNVFSQVMLRGEF